MRAVTQNGTSAWSAGYGFNIRWNDVPKQATSYPGLARWTPVEGATSYQVWFTGINRVVETRVNAVDQREFYAFHQGANFTGSDQLARPGRPAGREAARLHHSGQLRAVEPDVHARRTPRWTTASSARSPR